MTRITGLRTFDLRFPTSLGRISSDAMNPDPDYSAAYVVLETDLPGLEGYGLTFTIGRGTEVCVAAIEALAPRVVGLELDAITAEPARFWRHVTGDSQLRWIGPDKGAMHLAVGAVVNAVWDLWAKSVGKPVWRLVAEMTPEEIVRCIDFRYLTDAVTPEEAIALSATPKPTCPASGRRTRRTTSSQASSSSAWDASRGAALMKRMEPAALLAVCAACSLVAALLAVMLGGHAGLYALVAASVFMSVQYPTIFALGVQGLGALGRAGASLLVMAVVGGAVLTGVMGLVSDRSGIHAALLVPAVSFTVVLAFALSALRAAGEARPSPQATRA